jgi:hypothetical protein
MKRRKTSVLRVREEFPGIDVSMAVRRGRPLSSAAQLFLSCVEEVARSFSLSPVRHRSV